MVETILEFINNNINNYNSIVINYNLYNTLKNNIIKDDVENEVWDEYYYIGKLNNIKVFISIIDDGEIIFDNF
jgi:hypothetical protein